MAVKGSFAKQEIANKILETFPGSFLYNDGKEIRVNWTEDGAPLQIKIVLTAAKVAVEGGSDVALPGEERAAATAPIKPIETSEKIPQEPSEEEKQRLVDLLNKLGL